MYKQNYDAPVLMMIQTFNNHIGEEIDMVTLRDEWYYKMGEQKDNKFVYWLDLTLEIAAGDVKLVYTRQPGWYTEIMFLIEREIKT